MALSVSRCETKDLASLTCGLRFWVFFTQTDGSDIALLPRMNSDNASDRRDQEMRDALLDRFRYEILHTPGLALTPEQASRLFDVPRDVCGRLLTCLAREGAIYLRSDGRFVGLAPATASYADVSDSARSTVLDGR